MAVILAAIVHGAGRRDEPVPLPTALQVVAARGRRPDTRRLPGATVGRGQGAARGCRRAGRSAGGSGGDSWLRRWYGEKIYRTTWRPLLIGKFGPYHQQVNMAWMWARLKVRSPRLGYFEGGFQAFVETLTAAVEARGGRIKLNCPVQKIEGQEDGRLLIQVNGQSVSYDRCLTTTSPGLFQRMMPDMPEDYLGQLNKLKSMGAVVLVLALKHSLMEKTYWLNLPAETPD
jgi:protoporphyrinogen oxidase